MSAVVVAPWPRSTGLREVRRAGTPRLRVVREVGVRTRRRRIAVAGLALAAVLAVLAMVAFHAMVAQSQVRLDELERRTEAAERRYEEARFEHAQLSAPQRIVERATALGLEAPDGPPTPVVVEGAPPATPDATSTTLRGWSEVKPTLDDGS